MRNRPHTRCLKATRMPRTRRMLRQDQTRPGGELGSFHPGQIFPLKAGNRAADWSGKRPCKASEQLNRANLLGQNEMASHSSVLAWRIPGTGEPGGLPSMGSHRVRHDWSDLAVAAAARTERCVFSYFLFQAFMELLLTWQLVAVAEFSFVPGSTQN